MANKWAISIIILIILGGLFSFLYLKYERPQVNKVNTLVNLSIYAVDKYENPISTGFKIYSSGVEVFNGTTFTQGALFYQVPSNTSIKVINYNLENQNYYSYSNEFISEENIKRVRILLEKPSELKILKQNDFLKDYPLKFNISTKSFFRNVIVCADYSTGILWLKSNYTDISRLNNHNKCFSTGISLNESSNEEIILDYKIWGSLKEKDYLKIYFIDSDEGVSFDEEGNDLFAPNGEVILTINNI